MVLRQFSPPLPTARTRQEEHVRPIVPLSLTGDRAGRLSAQVKTSVPSSGQLRVVNVRGVFSPEIVCRGRTPVPSLKDYYDRTWGRRWSPTRGDYLKVEDEVE